MSITDEIYALLSDFHFLVFSNSLLFIFQFLNLSNSLFPNFLIFNLLGSPPHYFLIFNIFNYPTRYFLNSNFLNSVTHQWAAKGRQRSRWKGRFFTSMCNLYSCTDHWKGEIWEVENKRLNNGGRGKFWVNVYLETNGSFYVNKKEPEEYRWEANSFFWGKHGIYSPICLSVDNLNFYLCATHIAPRHKCLLRRTTCRKSSGW